MKLILFVVQYYKATISQLKKKILTMTLNKSHFMMNKINTMINITLGLGWWRSQWQPTPVLLPGKSHGWRSLVGCSSWGHEELDTTERLHFHFSLSCIGEGNGNPLQCSCLENPRDGGAWWAAVYGVAQSWTRLKRLSSSSGKTWLKESPILKTFWGGHLKRVFSHLTGQRWRKLYLLGNTF